MMPERWEIVPRQGAGPLPLGMPEDDVLRLFGPPTTTFLRAGRKETNEYEELGVFILYDEERRVEFFEFFEDKVQLWGLPLVGTDVAVVRQKLKEANVKVIEDSAGFECPEILVTFYHGGSEKVETAGMYVEGYYGDE